MANFIPDVTTPPPPGAMRDAIHVSIMPAVTGRQGQDDPDIDFVACGC